MKPQLPYHTPPTTTHLINGWPQWKTHPECDEIWQDGWDEGFCHTCQQDHFTMKDGGLIPLTSLYTPEEWDAMKGKLVKPVSERQSLYSEPVYFGDMNEADMEEMINFWY